MATVEKKLKTLDVYLLYDGEKVTISDTADDNKATRALNEFKKYETMHYETEENGQKVTNAIPYHAVEHIEATESGGQPTTLWTANGLIGEEEVSGNLPNENSPNYPIGRYKWDYSEESQEDKVWVYMGEPTSLIGGDVLEVRSDNGMLKAYSCSAYCDFWDNDVVDTDAKSIEVNSPPCM